MEINQIQSGMSIIGGGKIQSNQPNSNPNTPHKENVDMYNSSSINTTDNTGDYVFQIPLTSPQIQSFLNQKSREEKYVQCAPFLRCKESVDPKDSRALPKNMRRVDSALQDENVCFCEGFKYPQLDSLVSVENGILNFRDEQCISCHHKLTSHGQLASLTKDELDICTHFCIQINTHEDEASNPTIDPQKKQRHQNIIAKLRMAVQNPGIFKGLEDLKKEQNELGLPPFERPTIAQVLQNFLDIRAATGRRSMPPQQLANDQEIITYLMGNINSFVMDLPDSNSQLTGSTQLASSSQFTMASQDSSLNSSTTAVLSASQNLPSVTSQESRGHIMTWKRWKFYCSNPALRTNFRITDIFGKSVLKIILPRIKGTITWPSDLSQPNDLVSELEKEIMNDKSPIFELKKMEVQHFITAASRTDAKRKSEPPAVTKKIKVEQDAKPKIGATSYVLPPPFEPTESYLKEINERLGAEDREQKSRDQKARAEERKGIIRFTVIANDSSPQNMIWLANLKNIFAKQLPKMPIDYIVRLVFDRNHRSLLLLRDTTVLGGITFRPFLEHKFIEIAFCAVTSSEQVKGYGTHLMNHLKDAVQPEGLSTFLTYADNYAIGYFRKQGFDKKITFEQSKWKGRIKDYDGGTLMQCRIYLDVPYLKIPEMVSNQRKMITDRVSMLTSGHVQHTGMNWSHGGIININDIPGIKETGYTYIPKSATEKKKLQDQIDKFMTDIKNHYASWPFRKAVCKKEVPDYYEVVKDPIDLEMVDKRIKNGNYYITKDIFLSDIRRICDNCKIYNREDTDYHKCALEIENEFLAAASKYFPE